jgi:hypothetical protein
MCRSVDGARFREVPRRITKALLLDLLDHELGMQVVIEDLEHARVLACGANFRSTLVAEDRKDLHDQVRSAATAARTACASAPPTLTPHTLPAEAHAAFVWSVPARD